ncbi:MAG: MarR family transcriptional regulator [Mucilaginibacter sp.]
MQIEEQKKVTTKLVYLLKRFMDEWNERNLCRMHYPGFNYAHLPMFMSIGTSGISNNALAEKLNVSKQAASKIVKELESINMVRSEKCPNDARSSMLFLTSEGEKYYNYILTQTYQLEEKYKKLVGARNYEIATDVMLKLINFHEQQCKEVD